MSSPRRTCIIGAGTAGLCALKHALEQGMDATTYEQSDEIGGTWVYSEHIKTDIAYDDDVHSSMYEGLRTNLPKEVMGYPDYLYPESTKESFVSSADVLKFLQSYTEHFNLQSHIRFQHEVIRVRPRNGDWEVYVRDRKTNNHHVAYFDYVFVCNGHYTTPQYPCVEGMDVYGGKKMHSHLYRKADIFKDATVLIMGAGPSGMDITNHIYKSAKRIFLSHHLAQEPATSFMPNVTQKPDVVRFTETDAIFKDGTSESVSFVIFCTGYKFTYPFLSADTGVRVDDNFVQPLFKHCININYPTMALIGLPFNVIPNQLFDMQVRFALKFYTGQKQFPSRDEMLADTDKEMQQRWASGLSKRLAHQMGQKQFDYYKDLVDISGIANIKPVIGKIMSDCSRKYIFELETYRDSCFKVIDDETFEKFTLSKS